MKPSAKSAGQVGSLTVNGTHVVEGTLTLNSNGTLTVSSGGSLTMASSFKLAASSMARLSTAARTPIRAVCSTASWSTKAP